MCTITNYLKASMVICLQKDRGMKASLYCSEPPGCICEKCLYHWSGRCPYGSCYDDLRAKINPYDKAHPGEPPRTSWSSWREDQAAWCRGGIFYQSHDCDKFVEYTGSTVKECLEANVQIYQDGYIHCSLVESVGCEECMRRFEGKQAKKEEEEVAKKTYWTKCGHEFEKNSTATVTGFEIPDSNERIISGICAACPFPVEVTEGWGENKKHVRWECRAGSQPPNHKTEWAGNLDDKNTIQINSLDYNLLEEIREYCEAHPDLGAGYNTDHLADCRRTLSVCCSPNKKGITAKHELIEKFFQDDRITQVRNLLSTLIGKEIRTHYNTGGIVTNVIGPHNAYGPGSWTINYTEDGKKRKNPCIINSIKVENGIITCDGKPLQIIEPKKDDETCEESQKNTGSGSCVPGAQEIIATSNADKPAAMTARDSSDTEAESCANCQVDKEFCQEHQACIRVGLRPDECVCVNWIGEAEENEVMKNENACPYGKLSCDCRCINSIDGHIVCDAIRRKDWDRYHYVKEMQGKVHCDIFDKLAAEIIAEKNEERLERQKNAAFLTKNVTKTDEVVTFDYSTVDEETGAFLQERANNIILTKNAAAYVIGKELKEAQQKLSSHDKTKGTFIKWVKSLDFSDETAYNYMNLYSFLSKQFGNIDEITNAKSFLELPAKLQYAVSKPSARPELQQAVLAGDIKTHKEYKELEERLREAEARANEAVRLKYQADSAKIKAESEFKKLSSESANHIKDNLKTIRELNQQLDQAKRNSDPAKIQELGQIISDKQREIDDLRQQLKDKPIEATASRVVEKLPDDVQEYLSSVYDTMRHMQNFAKVNQVLNLIVGLSTDELQSWAMMMNNRKAVGDDEESETLELLGMAIQSLEDMKEDYESRGCE
jgi:hypothetical protein